MKTVLDNIEAPPASPQERRTLDKLNELVQSDERPALVGREGVRIELPNAIFHVLVRAVREMRQGKGILILPENECFTTQSAANFLGMSRPFLVKLLEEGQIPFHRVGAHRRVYLKDLVAYNHSRDRERREVLDKLTDEVVDAGLYESVDKGNEG